MFSVGDYNIDPFGPPMAVDPKLLAKTATTRMGTPEDIEDGESMRKLRGKYVIYDKGTSHKIE